MTDDSMQDQQFVEYVLKAIVEHPDAVKVTRTIDELGVLLTVEIHKDDMGTVIGRNGQTAKSIRTLLRVIGAKSNARVNMKILEPEGGSAVKFDNHKGDDGATGDHDNASSDDKGSSLDDDLGI